MRSLLIKVLAPVLLFFFSCKQQPEVESISAADPVALYGNGNIITMEGDSLQYVEAVVTRGERIVYTGGLEQAERTFPEAERFDLHGSTLIPGLIEPHLHPSLAAVMLQNEIIAPYDWKLPIGTKKGVQDHDAYIDRITTSIEEDAIPGKLHFIWGYHQLWHGDISRELLNKIAGDKPVGIIHRSFHEIFLNDAAIQLLGLKEEEFAGNPQVNWDKGHFYEGGWLALVPRMAPILLEPE